MEHEVLRAFMCEARVIADVHVDCRASMHTLLYFSKKGQSHVDWFPYDSHVSVYRWIAMAAWRSVMLSESEHVHCCSGSIPRCTPILNPES